MATINFDTESALIIDQGMCNTRFSCLNNAGHTFGGKRNYQVSAVLQEPDGSLTIGRNAITRSRNPTAVLHRLYKRTLMEDTCSNPRPGETLSPIECYLAVYEHILKMAQHDFPKHPVTTIIATFPVEFHQTARQRFTAWAGDRGITPVLVDDATAILSAYETGRTPGTNVVTVSVGGHSSDVSFIHYSQLGYSIIAKDGRSDAGQDIDQLIYDALMAILPEGTPTLSMRTQQQLMDFAEKTKINMSDDPDNPGEQIDLKVGDRHVEFVLERAAFDRIIEAFADRLITLIRSVIDAAAAKLGGPAPISAVLLEGGTLLNPRIVERLTAAFPTTRDRSGDYEMVAVDGLSAIARSGERPLSDACYTAIELVVPGDDGLVGIPLVPKNGAIPMASPATYTFNPLGLNAESYPVAIMLGEQPDLLDRTLGSFADITSCPEGRRLGSPCPITVRLSVDGNAIYSYRACCEQHQVELLVTPRPMSAELCEEVRHGIRASRSQRTLNLGVTLNATRSMGKAFASACGIAGFLLGNVLQILRGKARFHLSLFRDHRVWDNKAGMTCHTEQGTEFTLTHDHVYDERGTGPYAFDVHHFAPASTREELQQVLNDPHFQVDGGGSTECDGLALQHFLDVAAALPKDERAHLIHITDTLPHGVLDTDRCEQCPDIPALLERARTLGVRMDVFHVVPTAEMFHAARAVAFWDAAAKTTRGAYVRLEEAADSTHILHGALYEVAVGKNIFANICLVASSTRPITPAQEQYLRTVRARSCA